jgi:hypothetical protein
MGEVSPIDRCVARETSAGDYFHPASPVRQDTRRREDRPVRARRPNRRRETSILTYGAALQALLAPDRDGHRGNVGLGFATLAEYVENTGHYFGATRSTATTGRTRGVLRRSTAASPTTPGAITDRLRIVSIEPWRILHR